MALLPLALLALICAFGAAHGACPRKCECLWRSAKITVDCSGQGLRQVPGAGVEPQTQVLNISGNRIAALEARQFLR